MKNLHTLEETEAFPLQTGHVFFLFVCFCSKDVVNVYDVQEIQNTEQNEELDITNHELKEPFLSFFASSGWLQRGLSRWSSNNRFRSFLAGLL